MKGIKVRASKWERRKQRALEKLHAEARAKYEAELNKEVDRLRGVIRDQMQDLGNFRTQVGNVMHEMAEFTVDKSLPKTTRFLIDHFGRRLNGAVEKSYGSCCSCATNECEPQKKVAETQAYVLRA